MPKESIQNYPVHFHKNCMVIFLLVANAFVFFLSESHLWLTKRIVKLIEGPKLIINRKLLSSKAMEAR